VPEGTGNVIGALRLGEKLAVQSFSARGWYEVALISGDGTGWVRVAQASLSGDCSQVPEVIPTETPAEPQNRCILAGLTNEVAYLYVSADRNSTIISEIETVANVRVLARAEDDNWYRARYDGKETTWVGWVNAGDVTLDTRCNRDVIETVIMPTPVVTEVATQTPLAPEVLRFVVADGVEIVAPGDSVTLQWFVENTGQVSIEMYAADVQPADYGLVAPLATFANLSPQGELEATIPSQYNPSNVVFVLVLQKASGLRRDLDSLLTLDIQR
jgi:hypothetical protein